MPVVRQPRPRRYFQVVPLATVVVTAFCSVCFFLTRSAAQVENPDLPTQASARPEFLEFAPPQPWVDKQTLDLSSPRPAETDAGMYLRLRDQQVHLEKHARYSRYADEFVNVAGLHEQAEVVIEYDPAYQKLTLHEVVLHRHGHTIDVLAAARSQGLLRLLTPEEDVNDKILSGHRQVLLPIPGASVGDVLDYSYTLSGHPPFFGDGFTDLVFLQRAEPVHQLRYRLLKSPKRELFFKTHRSEILPQTGRFEPIAKNEPPLEQYVWQQRDSAPIFAEPDTPEWYQPFAFIQITSFANWNDVARHGLAFYDFPDTSLPADLNQRIANIRLDHSTPEARALAAVRLVQDDIRYLAVTDGAGAYCPDPPATTWQHKFGDCKNKTTLLKRILSELEIDSTPVYVDLDASPRGFQWLATPSAEVFDHVILRIDFADGKTAWADGTVSLERGPLSTTDPGDFFIGLPLAEDTEGLVKLPAAILHETPPHRHVVENYQLGDIGQNSQLKVHTTYRRSVASDKRHFFAVNHPVLIRRNHARLYRQNFPTLEFPEALPTLEDDTDTGELHFTQNYQLGDLWQRDPADDGYYSFYLYFDSIRDSLKLPLNPDRAMPLAIGAPRHFQHTSIVHLPADQEWEFGDEDHFIEEAGVRFERTVRQDGHQLRIDVQLSNANDSIRQEQIQDYAEAINDMIGLCHYSIWRMNDRDVQLSITDSDSPSRNSIPAASTPQAPNKSPLRRPVELAICAAIGALLGVIFRRRRS